MATKDSDPMEDVAECMLQLADAYKARSESPVDSEENSRAHTRVKALRAIMKECHGFLVRPTEASLKERKSNDGS